MKLEKINSYKKLDIVMINIIEKKPEPVKASEINHELHTNYDPNQLYITNRSISARLRGNPNIRVISGRCNRYTTR